MYCKDFDLGDSFVQKPTLQSPMRVCTQDVRPESPSDYMMDLDDPPDTEEGLKYGCLILGCAECSSAVLVEYSSGAIPGLPRLSSTSPRGNGVALTDCRNCFNRTRKGLEGRAYDNRGQFRMARAASMCPSLWETSDLARAAAIVLEEPVGLMLVGRVCLHLGWDRVARAISARDRVTSLDISQVVTGDARKIVLPHLAGNWV